MVDVSGINTTLLVRELWKASKPAAFFNAGFPQPLPPTDEVIQKTLERSNYCIDYLAGRVFKCDFSTTMVSPRLYDRDNGEGAFAAVVKKIRSTTA